jgi:hypothetical protein
MKVIKEKLESMQTCGNKKKTPKYLRVKKEIRKHLESN